MFETPAVCLTIFEGKLNKVLIADIVKEIIPSNESSNTNYRAASQAEFDGNNDLPLNNSNTALFIDSFESFEKFDSGLPSYTNSRQVIKWLHEDQTKVGDVKRFTLNEGYLVAKAINFNKKSLGFFSNACLIILQLSNMSSHGILDRA